MALPSQSKDEDIYQVEEGDCLDPICPICDKGSDPTNNDHACRVCGRVFHRACCENNGKYSGFDLEAMDRAFTPIGWSCLDCDNIAMSALKPEFHMQISDIFEKYDKNGDGSITLEEYLSTRVHTLKRDLTAEEEEEETGYFHSLDRDDSGEIDFAEFLAHEAVRYIKTYKKEELIQLMTPLEKKSVRRLFDLLDRNHDGVIDMLESVQRFEQMSWYKILQRMQELKRVDSKVFNDEPTPPPMQGRRRSSVVGQNLCPQSLHIRKCDENRDGTVSWDEFLRGHALDVIIARPNKSNEEVRLLGS